MNSKYGLTMLFSVSFIAACAGASSDTHPPSSPNDAGAPNALGGGPGTGGLPGASAGAHAVAGSGGASAGSTNEQAGSGTSGGLPSSVECNKTWPANAPALKDNAWTTLNPSTLKFQGEPQMGPFAQGLAVDPCNPSTLYLCINNFEITQGAGLFKSVNAGADWTRVGSLDEPLRVRVDPKNPLHLYAVDGVRGDTLGFWISQDGGNTWAKPEGWKALMPTVFNIDDLYDAAVDPADFAHILVTFHSPWGTATAGQNSGVMESKDGGSTWTAHQPMGAWGAGLNVWFLSNASTWLVGTQSDGYFRTANSGMTWTQVSMTPMFHGGGQLYKVKGGALYVSSSTGVLRSTDDGVSWTSVGSVPPATSVFGDGTRLYSHSAYQLGTTPFVTSPESDGLTWTPLNSDGLSDGPFEMAFDSQHGIVYSANWGNGLIALKVPAVP